MLYYQETTNNIPFFVNETMEDRDEEEVSESEAEEEHSCGEEARYNPSMPAYLQLPLGNSESPGKVQPCSTRQQPNNFQPKKRRKIKCAKTRGPKRCCLGVSTPKQIPITTICMISIVDLPSNKWVRVWFAIVDYTFATNAFAKSSRCMKQPLCRIRFPNT